MPIADLATASSETTGTSLTYAHSVAGTTDLAMLVGVTSFRSQANRGDPTSLAYAGGALAKIGSFLGGSGNDNCCSLWVRAAPSTGANNVVVTHSQSHDITALSYSVSGVDQTTPNDAVQTLDTADGDPTHSVSSATDDLVVSFIMGWAWTSLGEDGDLTIRLENSNGTGLNSIAVADAPGAASVNASWTTGSVSDMHGLFSVNLTQAAAGGAEERDLDGAQPAATGALARLLAALRGLAGSQPTGTAALTRLLAALRSLTGTQPTPTGALARLLAALRSLSGDWPTAAGALTRSKANARSLAGSQPAGTAALAGQQTVSRSVAGSQPTATGALTRVVVRVRSLAGNQPTGTGALSRLLALLRSLSGEQPTATGALSRQADTSQALAGAWPAPEGNLTRHAETAVALAGSWPTATGALTYFQGETDVPGHLTLGESLVAEALLGDALADTVGAGEASLDTGTVAAGAAQ